LFLIQSAHHQLPRHQAASPHSLRFMRCTTPGTCMAIGRQWVNGQNIGFEERFVMFVWREIYFAHRRAAFTGAWLLVDSRSLHLHPPTPPHTHTPTTTTTTTTTPATRYQVPVPGTGTPPKKSCSEGRRGQGRCRAPISASGVMCYPLESAAGAGAGAQATKTKTTKTKTRGLKSNKAQRETGGARLLLFDIGYWPVRPRSP
jgi:hypothetical protein